MLKKLMLPILIVFIIAQLLVPVGMISYGNKAEDDLPITRCAKIAPWVRPIL